MPRPLLLGPLTATAPQPPNFHICNSYYGEGLKFADCNEAGHELLNYNLPVSLKIGDCIIAVERAGQQSTPLLSIDRDVVRGMIGWVIGQCVTPTGVGGFVTASFENMVNYFTNPSTIITELLPPWAGFLTVTVAGNPRYKDLHDIGPGDYDPAVPMALADSLRRIGNGIRKGNPYAVRYFDDAKVLEMHSKEMERSSLEETWWRDLGTVSTDLMTYECDAKLGSPTAIDCSQLEYSSLIGAPSDSVTIGPEMDQFLSLGTCSVAITASVHLVLTWSQIRIALDTLINQCVSNPLKPAIGGRAYFERSSSLDSLSRQMRRDTLDGLNALPLHANITLFKQNEPIRSNVKAEFETCTWHQILIGGAVASCH
ncbi:hypothetical protein MMC14_004952 [Varicellaria rhodocarpa]|nr:hypothetical protein [Varicellaria rhodocarpa]